MIVSPLQLCKRSGLAIGEFYQLELLKETSKTLHQHCNKISQGHVFAKLSLMQALA